MVLKSALAAAVCTGFLALASSATAAEYRPGELLSLDLPKAVLSPKRIGPEARFGPVRIEARSEDTEADLDSTDLAQAAATQGAGRQISGREVQH